MLDVIVVGYGPVGALLANLLGRDGLRTAVFEREREVYRLPRAVHFDHEVTRIFQSVGLTPDQLPETAPILGYEFRNGDGELLFRFPLTRELTHQGWQPDYMFHQPGLEAALRDAAAKRECVEVHLEHEVLSLDERDDRVALEVRDLRTGGVRAVEARMVVGCDGANSFVRKAAGLELEDLEFDEPWLVVDATIRKPREELGLPTPCVQLCDPRRPVTFVPVAGPYIRWEFMLRPDEGKEEMLRPERVRELIAAWTDPDEVEVIRSAVYDFHAVLARRWNTKRVHLAGDSAHQMPPFLGQGLCSGVRDAANLAWKLGLVLRGGASEKILESYGPERSPHVGRLIRIAIDLGRIICTQDPELARNRDESYLARPSRDIPVPDLPGIADGLIQPAPRSDLAGSLGLQARVRGREGRPELLDDVTGPGFVLLQRGGQAPELSPRAREVRDATAAKCFAIIPEVDLDGAYARWLDAHGCDAVLVRPDHHVYGAAAGPAAASSLFEALGAQLGGG